VLVGNSVFLELRQVNHTGWMDCMSNSAKACGLPANVTGFSLLWSLVLHTSVIAHLYVGTVESCSLQINNNMLFLSHGLHWSTPVTLLFNVKI
jgi:hypothetical protein